MIEIPQVIRDYIDGLDDEGRDRIISGRLIPYGGPSSSGAGCIVELGRGVSQAEWTEGERDATDHIQHAFDCLVGGRYYEERDEAIAAVKAYAARNYTPALQTSQHTHDSQLADVDAETIAKTMELAKALKDALDKSNQA